MKAKPPSPPRSRPYHPPDEAPRSRPYNPDERRRDEAPRSRPYNPPDDRRDDRRRDDDRRATTKERRARPAAAEAATTTTRRRDRDRDDRRRDDRYDRDERRGRYDDEPPRRSRSRERSARRRRSAATARRRRKPRPKESRGSAPPPLLVLYHRRLRTKRPKRPRCPTSGLALEMARQLALQKANAGQRFIIARYARANRARKVYRAVVRTVPDLRGLLQDGAGRFHGHDPHLKVWDPGVSAVRGSPGAEAVVPPGSRVYVLCKEIKDGNKVALSLDGVNQENGTYDITKTKRYMNDNAGINRHLLLEVYIEAR